MNHHISIFTYIGVVLGYSEGDSKQPQPVFVAQHSGNVTAILGKTAILNCRVNNVANR